MHLHENTNISNKDYQVIDTFKSIGYAKSTPEEFDLLTKIASQDAVLFDPVYTIKAWRVFINLAKTSISLGDRHLFIHTGGICSLYPGGGLGTAACGKFPGVFVSFVGLARYADAEGDLSLMHTHEGTTPVD